MKLILRSDSYQGQCMKKVNDTMLKTFRDSIRLDNYFGPVQMGVFRLEYTYLPEGYKISIESERGIITIKATNSENQVFYPNMVYPEASYFHSASSDNDVSQLIELTYRAITEKKAFSSKMTKYEILVCIYLYLNQQWLKDGNKSEEYMYYIGNCDPFIWADKSTADPAYYEIFMEIFNRFFQGEECSVQDGFTYAKRYLEEYNVVEHEEYSYNIDEVVEVFNKCTLSEWTEIYKTIKSER